MAAQFARTRKAPSRAGALHYAHCPKCDAEYDGWRGMTQDFDAAQAQADEHNATEHGGQS
jgi:Cu/Zn superoxide dismutase